MYKKKKNWLKISKNCYKSIILLIIITKNIEVRV